MSKKFRKFRDFEVDEDYYDERGHRDELIERRKMKRMRNALRSKNIDEFMRDD